MTCKQIDSCPKIKMVLDKDLQEWQYAELIKKVCAACKDKPELNFHLTEHYGTREI